MRRFLIIFFITIGMFFLGQIVADKSVTEAIEPTECWTEIGEGCWNRSTSRSCDLGGIIPQKGRECERCCNMHKVCWINGQEKMVDEWNDCNVFDCRKSFLSCDWR